ncbi:MAG: DUF3363 domain-containing protein [Sphingorhabdus sp.]
MIDQEDRFRVRTGKARRSSAGSRHPQKFVSEILRAANRSGRVGGLTRSARSGSNFGRGRAAALGMNRHAAARRVIIKTRIVRNGNAPPGALSQHISYLERDGVTRDGQDAALFDAGGDDADRDGFAERCEEDRHHFRFMVSPEDAAEMEDLRGFTRELMADMERDLDTRLDWQAVDHWNTDNPHIHILVRGRDDIGNDLIISKDYISHGMRGRAEERVSLELGPRSEREINADLKAQVTAERWTKLDQVLQREANDGDGIVNLRTSHGNRGDNFHRSLIGRAQHLEKMELAFPRSSGRWSLHPNMETTLRDLGIRGDIVKTMHRAMKEGGRRPNVSSFSIGERVADKPVLGKFIARGLHDELTGEAYAIVDGVDGKNHYLRFGDISVTSDAGPGAIVESRQWTDARGRTSQALAVRSDFDLEAQIKAGGATWIDRQLLANKADGLGGGFGNKVRDAMEKRIDHLAGEGLAKRQGRRVTFARNLIATLRNREFKNIAARIEQETGIRHLPSAAGDYLTGTYTKRLQLASGRFAMIESISEGGKSFELVPWRPALEEQLHKSVQGLMMAGGRVDWNLGRQKGLSR